MNKYKIKKGFLIQKIKNKATIFSGEDSLLYTLNDSAAYIFQGLKLQWKEEKIINGLTEQYGITKELANEDFSDCIRVLTKYKIIQKNKFSS